jgi:hypothetical protein
MAHGASPNFVHLCYHMYTLSYSQRYR